MADDAKECFVATVKLRPTKEQRDVIDKWFRNATLFYNFMLDRTLSEFKRMFENERFRNCWNYGWKFRKLGRLRTVQSKLKERSEKEDGLPKKDAEFLEELPSTIRSLEDDLAFVHDEYFPDSPAEKTYSLAYRDAMGFLQKWIINEPEQAAFGYKPCTFSKFGFLGLGGCILQNVEIDGAKLCDNGVNSKIGQAICERLWGAWDRKLAFENFGRKVFLHDKDRPIESIKFKDNGGVKWDVPSRTIEFRFKDNGEKTSFRVPFKIRRGDAYMEEVLSKLDQPVHTAIVGRQMGRTVDLYAQFTVYGKPPGKGRRLGSGKAGLDLGPSSVTVESDSGVRKWDLRNPKKITELVESLQVAMDADDRKHNPDNYDENGVAKKGVRNVHSKKYERLRSKLAYAKACLTAYRKNVHGRMIREIMEMGHDFVTEKDNVKEWQMRLEEPQGPLGSKENYGSSVMMSAPSEFVTRLERKVADLGGTLRRVPCEIACTQFDHTDGSFTKHPVSERTLCLSDGSRVDRDAISAFNLRHARESFAMSGKGKAAKLVKSADNFDVNAMRRDYERFLANHAEWQRTKDRKAPKKSVDTWAPSV